MPITDMLPQQPVAPVGQTDSDLLGIKPKSKFEKVADVLNAIGQIGIGYRAGGGSPYAQSMMKQMQEQALREEENAKQAQDKLLGLKLSKEKSLEERAYRSEEKEKDREFKRELAKIAASSKGNLDENKKYQLESQLRSELTPYTKEMSKVDAAFRKVKSAAENPSPAGDISLIFNYMKILDPGSVVREGEFATAQNAAGVPDRIRNQYNKIKEGSRLNPTQRQDFMSQAMNTYQAQVDSFNALVQPYEKMAQERGLNYKNISLYEPIKAPITPTQSTPVDYNKLSDEELVKIYKAKKGIK